MGKRIGAVLAIIGMLLACLYSATPVEAASVVVQVEADNLRGSGVLYRNNGENMIVVTAAHVLEQNEGTITITFSDGYSVPCNTFYISATSDLAFLNIPLQEIPDKNAKKYITVQIDKGAFDSIQGGSEVMFLAEGTTYTSAEEPEISAYIGTVIDHWIFIEDFNQYMMLIQGDIEPGMSGGGVFDTTGNFLGILCGESMYGEVAAVPLSIIEAEYLGVY